MGLTIMARTVKANTGRRHNIVLSEKSRALLQNLIPRTDADTMSEVIRRALVAYDMLVSAKEAKMRIIFTDGVQEREIKLL